VVLATVDIYGGTFRLFKQVYAKYGIEFRFAERTDAATIIAALDERIRMIWLESPTNPLLNVVDIAAVARARAEDTLLVVDNTFASPYFQRPLELGADIVVHSTTKYLGGHSDVVGGALVTDSEALYEACKFYQNAAGGTPGPLDCFLVQRGIKTLEVRMKRHEENAFRVAEFLRDHPRVQDVLYPGLPDHPGHEVARAQMSGFSGMVSFRLDGGWPEVDAVLRRFQLFTLAESLGGVESLACYPYTMTHAAIPEPEKLKIGITPNLIRLSVGIEDPEDLLADLEQALAGGSGAR